MRELTLTRVDHPTAMRFDPVSGVPFHITAFDHPSLRKVVDGDPALGWEGDERLAWYFDPEAQRIVLMRLEHDSQYRTVLVSQEFQIPNDEMANRIIRRLVATDVHRGYQPKEAVDAHNAKLGKAEEQAMTERHEEMADKLFYALKKDGADDYL